MARQPWARLTINLEPDVAQLVKRRAKAQRRSVSAYLQTLLERDLAGNGQYPEIEDAAALRVAEELSEIEALSDADDARRAQAAASTKPTPAEARATGPARGPHAKARASGILPRAKEAPRQGTTPVDSGRGGVQRA